MASIRKRQDLGGKFELSYHDVDGRRYRINTNTTDFKIATLWRKKAEELVSLAKLGVIEKVGRLTREVVSGKEAPETKKRLRLDEFEKVYLDRGKHDLELADRTLALHTQSVTSFREVVGNPFIDSISPEDVRKWKRAMDQKGSAKTTCAIYHRTLKAAFSRALKWKMITINPFSEVEIAGRKSDLVPKKSMTLEDVQKLLAQIDDPLFKRYVQFILYTGARRGEILYLKRDDLDLERRIIYINAQKTNRRLALPINNALMRVIEQMQNNKELPRSGYLFPRNKTNGQEEQQPWHLHTPTHRFKKYVRVAKLDDDYSLHSCRHTYATYLESKGVPREITMQLLGHSSTKTTSSYVHTSALFFREQANLIDFEPEEESDNPDEAS